MLRSAYLKRISYPFIVVLFGIALAFSLQQCVVSLSIVKGSSMQPTLQNGDFLLVDKISFYFTPPRRGDVITFVDPSKPGRFLVKRIVGMGGDWIEIKEGTVFINHRPLPERYIDVAVEDGHFGPVQVLPGTVFVMGDNRHRFASRDSRFNDIGLLPVSHIQGKVFVILWRPSLSQHL